MVAGQENHRDLIHPGIVFQAADSLKAVHAGHLHIQQDQIRLFIGANLQRQPAGLCQGYLIPPRKLGADLFEAYNIIIYNQY